MLLSACTVKDTERYLSEKDSILFGLGSIENHGRHMPLGTDSLIPQEIIERLEEKSEIMVAPLLPYGTTDGLAGFTGTINIRPEMLYKILVEICDEFYRHGFRHFIIVNGHGGNCRPLTMLGHHLYKKGALLSVINWWLMAGQLNPEWKGGHGGAEETAGVMAVDPSLVREEHLHDPLILDNDLSPELESIGWDTVSFKGADVVIPRPVICYNKNGWYGKDEPFRATEKWGHEMLDAMAEWLTEFIPVFEEVPLPEGEK